MQFPKLFEPGRIGSVELKNRIIRSAAGTESGADCHVTDATRELYRAFARGGAGLVIVEGVYVTYGLDFYAPSALRLDSDDYLPEMGDLASIIHEAGAKTFLQILHLGTWNLAPDSIPISSSTLTEDENPPMEQPFPPTVPPRGVSKDEIGEIVAGFADVAERAQRAGFDGVEINAAGAHFLNSFLSRVWNKRTDEYGPQTCENRARIICDIIRAVKRTCGDGFPVTVLFNGLESGFGEKCTTVEEAKEFARFFEQAGADALQVRNYGYGENTARQWIENTVYPEPVDDMPPQLDWSRDGAGAYVPLAKAVKEVVGIPVITVGRQGVELGERVLEQGEADFIAMQRRLIADPDLPNKAREGRLQDIKPCTACLYCASSPGTGRLTCRVNPRVGLPDNYELAPAVQRRRVAVVGGGPGGMEAARVAAERGHDVTLFEQGGKLGGLLPMASIVKGSRTEDLMKLVSYYETQLRELGVAVRLKTAFSPNMAHGFDAVVIAAGAKDDDSFRIPGMQKRVFVSNESLHTMLAALLKVFKPETLRRLTKLFMPLGRRVVIIGGSIQGAELAEFLVLRNREVTIAMKEPESEVGSGMASVKQVYLQMWLAKRGVRIVSDVAGFKEVVDKGLVVVDADGRETLLEADSVCTALPLVPNTDLADALASAGFPEVHLVGDCKLGDGLILDAIAQGYLVARDL